MFGFSPTCVDAFGEYPQAYGLGDYPTTAMLKVANSFLSLSCAVKSTLTENVFGYSQVTLRVSLTSNLGEVYE